MYVFKNHYKQIYDLHIIIPLKFAIETRGIYILYKSNITKSNGTQVQ